MKKLYLLLFLPLSVFSQKGKQEIEEKINKVENSLAPSVIYGDTLPRLNLETRMQQTHTKGLSIAVIRNYEIVWAKGYGWADEKEQRKVTTSTRFQAASISKSLNSLGILKLVEQGKLNPEADINKYLTTWKFPYDSLSKNLKISTYQLLSHTAGLTIHGFPGYERSDTLPAITQILDGIKPANTKAVRSIYEPGKKYEYSGGGITITQLMLTNITGRDYASFMQEEVLKPLGMNHSSYQQPSSDTSELATGYYTNGTSVKGKYHVYPEQAAAGLWTTPSDLARYIIDCQLTMEGRSHKVLSQAMMKKRLTPYFDSTFALGAFIDNRNGNKFFSHNGGNEAFVCTYYGSMQGGYGVVIMINGEDFKIISELLNSVARVYDWKGFYDPKFKKIMTMPADSLNHYVGDFQLNKDTLKINFCGKDLCIRQNSDMENIYKIYFSDYEHFSVTEVPDADFRTIRDEKGNIEALELKQRGNTIRLPKLK